MGIDQQEKRTPDQTQRRRYEPPRIVAYDEEALLTLLGPAVACASWSVGSSGDGDSSYSGDSNDW
jgi:hypothetical protein